MATVKHIETGFSNSALAVPYALARLDCGHCASVELLSHRGTCGKCGLEQEIPAGTVNRCQCGCNWFTVTFAPNPHNPEHRLTKVGDTVRCEECERNAQQIAWLEALKIPIQHARYRNGRYDLYRRDPTSPSGVMLVGSVPASAEGILRRKGIAMLSPTEGR